MNRIMLDLETLGTRPGCVVLSIGAVPFNAEGVSTDTFHLVIERTSSLISGLTEDPDTLAWWLAQSPEAQETLLTATMDGHSLATALGMFTEWLAKYDCGKVQIWGNGSDFDQPILAGAYHAAGMPLPWKFYNNRCYRTLKGLRPGIKMPARVGTHHNALDDAISQAHHASMLLRALGE